MLKKLIEIERDARDFGFDWTNCEMIIEQAVSECEEIREAIAEGEPPERVQEEIGDLLHTALALCTFAGFDVEQTAEKVAKKFEKRMEIMKQLTKEQGLNNLRGQSMDFMLGLWSKVKEQEKF